MFLSGLRPKTYYEIPLENHKCYIFTPNHFSYLDILSANVQMPYYFSFMAKSELAKIPLFNIFFKTIDITVVRNSVQGARNAYNLAINRLEDGISLLNFPEGGIGPTVPQMQEFKMGAFKMAIETGTEIVPITIIDNWKRLLSGGITNGGSPGKMRMFVHRPISTKNLKEGDEKELAQQVYRIIEAKFQEYYPDATRR
jgi:1-acyl-sn-glycerol-3-phosphate acyltransferase